MWEFLPIHSYLVVILSVGKKDDPSHTRFARSLKKPNKGKSAMQLLPWADIEVLQGEEGTESTTLLRDDLVIRISLELYMKTQSSSAVLFLPLNLSSLIVYAYTSKLNEMGTWAQKVSCSHPHCHSIYMPRGTGQTRASLQCTGTAHRLAQSPVRNLDTASLVWGFEGLIQAEIAQIGLRANGCSSPIFFSLINGAVKEN